MEENSRSDAINDLKDMIYKNNSDDVIEKAISDMEKLEKIEKTIKCYHSTSCDMCALDKCGEKTECSEGYLIKIKQILRGSEDGRD